MLEFTNLNYLIFRSDLDKATETSFFLHLNVGFIHEGNHLRSEFWYNERTFSHSCLCSWVEQFNKWRRPCKLYLLLYISSTDYKNKDWDKMKKNVSSTVYELKVCDSWAWILFMALYYSFLDRVGFSERANKGGWDHKELKCRPIKFSLNWVVPFHANLCCLKSRKIVVYILCSMFLLQDRL